MTGDTTGQQMNTRELIQIAELFMIEGEILNIKPTGNGHINDTFLVTTDSQRYILQRINTEVFLDPASLMENALRVTEYLNSRLSYIPTRDGNYCSDEYGNPFHSDQTGKSCWRMMTNIEDAYSCESISEPAVFCEIGRAYGAFISALADFPADTLNETIAGFHDTEKRFKALVRAVSISDDERIDSAREEIRFALEHEPEVDILGEAVRNRELPLRVTHNDTKINNVLLDSTTGKAACVIDLDTVMPGISVNDFGDAIRSGASTGREDEKDASKISLDIELYKSFAKGFIEGFPEMTEAERKMLPYGAKLMTLECGIRFLTDYLEGDHYFKTDYPEHNLVRCRTQFRLVQDMEVKWDEMKDI